uniref:Uncharacterized protein n=1 Tax=Prolemur simus TaxID=1328070 RepID=A0A8C8YCT3_PROSS
MVSGQLQKVEPPHGAITSWDARPGFSDAENLSSPLTALELTARSKSTAFSPPCAPASWWQPPGSLRKRKTGSHS